MRIRQLGLHCALITALGNASAAARINLHRAHANAEILLDGQTCPSAFFGLTDVVLPAGNTTSHDTTQNHNTTRHRNTTQTEAVA